MAFFRRAGAAVEDPVLYVAGVASTLPSLLNEALTLVELLFKVFDKDGAGTLMFRELEHGMAKMGFTDQEKLQETFKRVDFDGNGTLDFCEFLCLLYLWQEHGGYSTFFVNKTNADVVGAAFNLMEKAMVRYDADRSRSLDIKELNAFFQDQLPHAVESGAYQQVLDIVYPAQARVKGLKFPSFMHLLYDVMCRIKDPSSSLKGTYSQIQTKIANAPTAGGGRCEDSAMWRQLVKAFAILADDFNRFDTNNDKLVDRTEITAGIPLTRKNADKVAIISRLEFSFSQVDVDASNSLDFFEFMYLSFLMTQDGAYNDMVQQSAGAEIVKKMFIEIHSYYRRFDLDKNLRLTYDELLAFCTYCFGSVPDDVPSIFAEVKYVSSATQGRDAVDIIRFLKLLYELTVPDGEFVPRRYQYQKPAKAANVAQEPAVPPVSAHPPRIRTVIPAKFHPKKLLGQGGQGTVHLGDYDGLPCAGKKLLGDPGPDLVTETVNEVDFFMRLDHPNCHYLLGAKTTLDNGGIMLLTEVCDKGSIFDFYGKGGKKFSKATAWRLGRECAMGLQAIHEMGYMHRDIKSLNVFLTSDLVARVADFGMVTNEAWASDGCGTPQWMAPEVVANVLGNAKQYDRSVDVYSYGIMLWELFHCQCPYSDTRLDQMGICKQVYYSQLRPTISRQTPAPIQKIIAQCWLTNPNDRPQFDQVVALLDQARSSCNE